ncbi:APC family permease [Microbacterium trichothecenolyticum]|uniref:Amino acid transporter n=1 Tax=Microbacterium trichothecenolyticum TaxID=69370 RepID=A0ABU0TSS7_MICTR|nr:APC family permease [Microbacterium trichothecenolyticum]MDQ1122014.1 amino acid transporter [Microbacterium trichothecenolyticum]
MTHSSSTPPPGTIAGPTRLRGSLGIPAITLLVIAAAAPLTVIGGVLPVGLLIGDGVGFPTMFLVSALILVVFAIGMTRMSSEVPHASSFFGFIAHGLGRIPGTVAAWLAILCYSTVQFAVFAYLGGTISSSLALVGLPTVPWWIITLISVAIVGVLGYRHIELSSRVLSVVLLAEMSIVLVLAVAVIIRGGAEGISLAPFTPSAFLSGSPALGLMFAIASFIGFESTVVFRHEARDPDRTIGRATLTAAIVIGIFYAIGSWAIVMAWGPSAVVAVTAEDPTTLLARTTDHYLGPIGSFVITLLLFGSMFASVLGLHTVLARYLHAMAGAGLVPRRLRSVHPKHGSPHVAAVVQALSAVVLVVVGIIAGTDPALLFAWFAGVGTFIIVVLMLATSAGVVVYFATHRTNANPWSVYVAPIVSGVALLVTVVLIGVNFPLLVGDTDATGEPVWGALSIALVALVVVVAVIAIGQALYLRARRPDTYRGIVAALDATGDSASDAPSAETSEAGA